MRYFKCENSTDMIGTDEILVVGFDDDTSDQYIEEYFHDTAIDNAESYGVLDDAKAECEEAGIEFIADEHYSYEYEELVDMTVEEIEEEYGEVEYV